MEEIYVLDRKVRLLQPECGFRTSMDSVMLAAAVPAQDGESVLDAGCGVGGAAFCLLHRIDARLTGIDVNAEYIDLAVRNNALNPRQGEFALADIREYPAPAKPVFDHIMMNPPFFEAGAHTPSPNAGRAAANGHQEEDISLAHWVHAAHRLVKSKGSMTIIYPATGVDRIVEAMGRRFGAIEIIPLWSKSGEDARRVVVRARKDRQTPARIAAGIILHNPDGSYTLEAERILRDGIAI